MYFKHLAVYVVRWASKWIVWTLAYGAASIAVFTVNIDRLCARAS